MMILQEGQKLTEPCAAESLREALRSPQVRRALAGDHKLEARERKMSLAKEMNVSSENLTLQTIFAELRAAIHSALDETGEGENATRFFTLLDTLDRIAPSYIQAMTDGLLNISVKNVLEMINNLAVQLKASGSEELATCLLNVKLRVGQLLVGENYDPLGAPSIPVATGKAFLEKLAKLQEVDQERPPLHAVDTSAPAHNADRAHHHPNRVAHHTLPGGRAHRHAPAALEPALAANE